MIYHRSLKRGLILGFLLFLFLTNIGHTAPNESQGPPLVDEVSPQEPSSPPSNGNGNSDGKEGGKDQEEVAAEPLIESSSSSSMYAGASLGTGASSSFLSLLPQIVPDPNTGAARVSIPIEVPPGRRGIAPNLALTYNSNKRNGWIGMGWNIPIGFIQRSTKRGVDYSANDYVVDGSKELVQRGDWGTNYYGARIEGAFSKYYYNSLTKGWEVTTKGGTIYKYGTTSASRQDDPNNSSRIFKWMLDEAKDTNGNYMTFSYIKDQGELYIDRIDYTSNGSLSPTNYVEFYLESRTDAPVMYTSNFAVKTAKRLKTIEVVANG